MFPLHCWLDTAIPSNDPDATLDDESDCAADGCLLSGRYFTIAGFGDEDVEYLWQLIESNGGKALKSKETRVADFAILNINTVPKEDIQAKQLVRITVTTHMLLCRASVYCKLMLPSCSLPCVVKLETFPSCSNKQ